MHTRINTYMQTYCNAYRTAGWYSLGRLGVPAALGCEVLVQLVGVVAKKDVGFFPLYSGLLCYCLKRKLHAGPAQAQVARFQSFNFRVALCVCDTRAGRYKGYLRPLGAASRLREWQMPELLNAPTPVPLQSPVSRLYDHYRPKCFDQAPAARRLPTRSYYWPPIMPSLGAGPVESDLMSPRRLQGTEQGLVWTKVE
jgi:hypothetical protein